MKESKDYNAEYQAAVEERMKRPIVDVEVIKRKNEEGEETEVCILDIAGVKVESLASKQEIEETIKEIHATPESLELLQAMAETFQQRRGLIVEGPTSRGKTYLMNKFTELIFGRNACPIDFYCNGQTDTISLMAKWVPKTENKEDEEKWRQWAESLDGRKKFNELIKATEEGLINQESIRNTFIAFTKEAGIRGNASQWEFQYGALPRAMTLSGSDGKPRGMFLHVQEVGLAETHVIDALLQLGGEKGKLAKKISLWEDAGRDVDVGPYFWVCYSTNPPENYPNRSGIDQALARRNTFFKLGEEHPSSRQIQIHLDNNEPYERIPELLRREVEERQKGVIFPIEQGTDYNSSEYLDIRVLISEAIADFHEKLREAMISPEEGKRASELQRTKQKFELTNDEWNMVFDFMGRFKSPDVEATLDRAVYLHYISRFTNKGQEYAWKLWEQIKTQKKFKERLEAALPKEEKLADVEAIGELNKFKAAFEENLKDMEKEIEEVCKLESE